VRRRAETKQAYVITRLDARHTQAAEADNAGAEQGSHVQIVQRFGKWINEIGSDESILSIAAVHCVSRKRWRVTEVFKTSHAIWASSVHSAHPRYAHPSPHREVCGGSIDDVAHNLMPGNQIG
jgi:hypothetical protein